MANKEVLSEKKLMFFQEFTDNVRDIFNDDIVKYNVLSWIIFNTNYSQEYKGLKSRECYFSYSILEEKLNVTRYKLQKIMKELINDGFIEWVSKSKSKGESSILKLNFQYGLEYGYQYSLQYGSCTENTSINSNINTVDNMVNNTDNHTLSKKHISKKQSKNINNIYSPLNNELCYEEENKSLEKDLLKQVDNSFNIKNETDVIAKKNVKLTQFKWKSKEYEEAFKEIWAIYPNKRGITNAKKSINKLLDHYSKDELMRAVKRYDSECKGKEIKYIKIGSTFFNSGYEDYLDENYISLDTSSTKKEYKPKSDNFD